MAAGRGRPCAYGGAEAPASPAVRVRGQQDPGVRQRHLAAAGGLHGSGGRRSAILRGKSGSLLRCPQSGTSHGRDALRNDRDEQPSQAHFPLAHEPQNTKEPKAPALWNPRKVCSRAAAEGCTDGFGVFLPIFKDLFKNPWQCPLGPHRANGAHLVRRSLPPPGSLDIWEVVSEKAPHRGPAVPESL